MSNMRCTTFFLTLFLSVMLSAQEALPDRTFHGPAYFENAQDSADFMKFRNGLQRVDPSLPMDTTTVEYRLLWRVVERGGITIASRGDGRVMRSAERVVFEPYALTCLPFRTADGRHVLVLAHEEPCALICRSTEYYVEE